tara:strand:+ start:685 stop:1620 length:936 start_codon:yes stop_codon:yes gene_type:complete
MPEKMVDIDTSGNPVDVDIKEEQKQDDVEVQEQQEEDTSVREVKPQQEQSNEEDLNEYSDGVKKRIDKLTAKMREAERREQAAIEFADGLKKQYTDLDKKYKDLDTGYLSEFKNRIEISKAALQDRYQKAVSDNDVKAQVEAQEELTKLTIDAERLRASEAKNSKKEEEGTEVKTPAAPTPSAQPDPRAERWASDNSWFGSDEAMTYTAISIHKKLVGQEGFDPKSEEYYSEIDKRMKNEFPHKLSTGEAGMNDNSADDRPVQAVASANRSSSKNARSKTVRLTPSQVAIAKKLGVPLTEYAKYVKQGGQA